MRVRTLPASLFQAARKRLIKELPPGALVILHANDIYPTNADGVMPFHQSSDLFYLSGVDQEETILVLFPDAPEEKHREMLFLRETNEHIAIWEGDKLSKEQAEARTGIKKESIHWLDKFEGLFRTLMCRAQHVFLNANEHARATTEVETRELRFIRRCQRDFPLHRYERLAPLLQELRVIKTSEETALIRDAIEITSAAFHRVLEFVRPGVMEFEIEAEIIHEFTRRRATHAFPPILGTGRNACVLHYITNHSECHDGELLLMDFGARSLGYHADLTRTVPVNGKFTKRQREIYDAVLRVQRAARKMLKPGVLLKPYQDDVGLLMQEELLRLKLITKVEIKESLESNPDKPAYKKYFPHGTSHHLGLDVHDVGDTWRKLEPGMVLTIEPGLYIREENIGVRLENDVLITKKGTEDLMDDIPIEPDAIEHLMARK